MPLSVSVVIPVRDEARSIEALLNSLCAQTRRPDEIVVCDAGSVDGTAEIAEGYARQGLPLRLIRIGDALPGRARNVGIGEARHDLVALTDAGIRLDPHWLERLLAPFAGSSPPDVVYGRFEPATASFRRRVIALACVPPRERRTGLRTPSVASMAMRRSVWAAVGGFPEDLRSAEDLLFIRRVGRSGLVVRYEPEALAHWDPPGTYTETFRRFAAYSRSNIHAGLAREWQIPLVRIYFLTALLTLTVLWTPLGGLAPLAMLGARASNRIRRERGIRGMFSPQTIAGTMLALAVIDLATLAGWWKWLAGGGPSAQARRRRVEVRTQNASESPTSLLYLCYLGVTEPLVQTQVVPYLGGLAAAGHGVSLLTFEPRRLSPGERRAYRDTLRRRGINWYTLPYHKRPALPATVVDIMMGVMYAAYLVVTRRVQVVHARSHVPAVMALALKRLLRAQFVFDIRGLMAEEYVDAGLWRRDGLLFRLVKRVDDALLRRADAAVVLTRRARRWLFDNRKAGPGDQAPVEVIPCCVDLERFTVDPARVAELRSRLGFDARPVMVYAGKFGGWYMTRAMVDFFCIASRQFPGLRFLILTQSPKAIVEEEFARRRVDRDSCCCLQVAPEELPAHLALADFAISFRAFGFSQIAASPTKMAEYLAAGLPVVYNSGVGDLEDLADEAVGAVVTAFNAADYERAARRIRSLLDDREGATRRCRAAAQRHFSLATVGIPGYLRLYAALTGRPAAATTAGGSRAASLGDAPQESAVR